MVQIAASAQQGFWSSHCRAGGCHTWLDVKEGCASLWLGTTFLKENPGVGKDM